MPISPMQGPRRCSDLISTLPNNLIENILVRTPIRDAVRTSVLSKKWVNAWKTLPHLVFDDTFANGMSRSQIVAAIYHVLLNHRGPILKFILSVSGLEESNHIDNIVGLVSDVEELELWIRMSSFYRTPPNLFSCPKLQCLHVGGCSIEPPPAFNGLKNLTFLFLINVIFNPAVTEDFFTKFPSLSRLSLVQCSNADHLMFHTPNLKHLWIESNFKSINFKDTWQLEEVLISGIAPMMPAFYYRITKRVVSIAELFSCLGRMQSLFIGRHFLKILAAGFVPPRLVADLNCLTDITFRDICFYVKAEVRCLICLIRSSPCLESISIIVYHGETGDADTTMEFLEVQSDDDMSFDLLRFVDVDSYKGTEPEMEFVKLILARSPVLETLEIILHEDIDTEEQIRIFKQITGFSRGSSSKIIIS